MRALALISIAVFALVIWEAVDSLREVLFDERQIKTMHVVESVHGVIAHFHGLELAGTLTREEAQRAALAAVKTLRYGGNEYFWINDMHEARANSQRTAALAERGEALASNASEGIAQISATVTSASQQIQVLRDRSGEIGKIADVIREISDQTNLLALNAAIEAARAGEQGRGFAVVADEVRKLAERTGVATTQISEVIASVKAETESAVASIELIVPKVESGSRLSQQAAEALREIRAGAGDTLERLGDVVSAMKELSTASNSVANNMQEVAEMAERSSAQSRSSAESSEQLKTNAEALEALTAGFRVTDA